ncbi:hypothetical protein SMACR_00399 [Sordaria macrospora]|uniref:WGS project CABT00000000 data, contig 2.1 n=2 Tax=Sordaria macrospora TaxID=5147 RepID=F7VL04_SORMK|nr:uncharacterized protein SMAC_00399 [Sordaria macrospora k-hell]KAA8632624.1 hypothetical protein SMACR_00399 [Sordaria macrospora]WPJ59144.1 hypothetical protein SMAC4_00399 [Sordaria macrospora]CCC06181.1 unnamed protein product [Sordaria macrospora k-hell]
MSLLRAFLFRYLPQRQLPNPNRLVSAGRLRAPGLSARLPLATGLWHYVGDSTQWNRLNSTKASQPNDKKRKPRLTKEEDEERRKKREERKKKQEEAVKRFNKFMGKRKLKDWQKLCKTIGLKGEFKSIQSCREAIEGVHVNIYDVLDADRINQAGGKRLPRRFSTPYELSEYTKRGEKFYPREEVKKGEPEEALLKHIHNPRLDEERQKRKEEMRKKNEEEEKMRKKKEEEKMRKKKEEEEKMRKKEEEKMRGKKEEEMETKAANETS